MSEDVESSTARQGKISEQSKWRPVSTSMFQNSNNHYHMPDHVTSFFSNSEASVFRNGRESYDNDALSFNIYFTISLLIASSALTTVCTTIFIYPTEIAILRKSKNISVSYDAIYFSYNKAFIFGKTVDFIWYRKVFAAQRCCELRPLSSLDKLFVAVDKYVAVFWNLFGTQPKFSF